MKTLKECIINEHHDVKGDLVKANEHKFIRHSDDVLGLIFSILHEIKFNEAVCMAIDNGKVDPKELYSDDFKENLWNCIVSAIQQCGEKNGYKWAQPKKK